MYIANPKTTINPTSLDCDGTTTMTLSFRAASALYDHPAEIILLLDRSAGITPVEMAAVRTAAKQFIRDVAIATNTPDPAIIASNSSVGIVSFDDTAVQNMPLDFDVTALSAAVDALQIGGGPANYKAAFETADQAFEKQAGYRHIVVLFSHSAETALADADPVAAQMKAGGVEIFCVGLLDDPAKLNLWARPLAKNHVSYTTAADGLEQVFHEIAAEVVLAGVLEGSLVERVSHDFRITTVHEPAVGPVQLTGEQTLTWTIHEAAIPQQPELLTLSFDVQHIGTTGGTKEINQSCIYQDRYGNSLTFPGAEVDVTCSGGGGVYWYPEPCPEPTAFTVPGCQDAARVALDTVALQGLGRIVQLDATLKAVCPGKQVAVSVMLAETAPDGTEKPRGVKHILVPAQAGDACKDITLKCIQFSLPEALDADGSAGSICNERSFSARVIANYVDTDFACCESKFSLHLKPMSV